MIRTSQRHTPIHFDTLRLWFHWVLSSNPDPKHRPQVTHIPSSEQLSLVFLRASSISHPPRFRPWYGEIRRSLVAAGTAPGQCFRVGSWILAVQFRHEQLAEEWFQCERTLGLVNDRHSNRNPWSSPAKEAAASPAIWEYPDMKSSFKGSFKKNTNYPIWSRTTMGGNHFSWVPHVTHPTCSRLRSASLSCRSSQPPRS